MRILLHEKVVVQSQDIHSTYSRFRVYSFIQCVDLEHL